MRNKVKAKKDSGITLVALIITIIILIILAAVTLKALFNDKLVETAIKAGEDYKLAQGQEMNELDKVNNKVTNIINGGDIGGEDPTPPKPPEIVGAISFGDLSWNNGKASVSITKNSEDSYTIEYKVTNKDNVVTREYAEVASGGIITDLSLGDLVTARLTDGTNHSKPADLNVLDENGPKVTIEQGTVLSNSIQVNITVEDKEAGMPDSPSYRYYIKKNTEGSYPETAAYTGSDTNKIFGNLEQNVGYDIKVVTEDRAGNTGVGEIKNITTKGIPGAGTEGGQVGAITFGNLQWDNGKASVTVTKTVAENYDIEYKVTNKENVVTRNYNTIANGGTITDLNLGDLVTARLTDGINHGKPADLNVEDGNGPTKPTIAITGGTKGNGDWYKESNVVLTITPGTDAESGVDRTTYAVTGTQNTGETQGTSVTISTNGTNTITAYTYDRAGNKTASDAKVIKLDKDGPQSVTLAQKTGTTAKGKKATVAGAVGSSFSGIASYKYEYKLSTASSYSGDTGNTHTVTALTDTYEYTNLTEAVVNNLKVTVTDNAGNTKTATCNVTPAIVYIPTSADVGKYVNYEPDGTSYSTYQNGFDQSGLGATSEETAQKHRRDTELKWRIWKVTKDEVQLISNKRTAQQLKLQNIAGFNNGVRLIDEICASVYSNSALKDKNLKVRNMKLSDIIGKDEQDKTVINVSNQYNQYGSQPYEYSSGAFPKIWADYDKNSVSIINREMPGDGYIAEQTAAAPNSTNKYSPYYSSWFYETMTSDSFSSMVYYNMVMGEALDGTEYWLTTRYTYPDSKTSTRFGLQVVRWAGITPHNSVYVTTGGTQSATEALRPFVSMPIDAVIWEQTTDGNIKISY